MTLATRVLVVALMISAAFVGSVRADSAPDKTRAQQAVLEFLALLDRGDTDKARSMFTKSVTTLDDSIASMRAAGIQVPVEVENLREQEQRRVVALRDEEFKREIVRRAARGRLQNTRVTWSEKLNQRDAFMFEIESDAEKPAQAPGGEAKTTVASVRVDKDPASQRYLIFRFTTAY
jgi:hypothetical protein